MIIQYVKKNKIFSAAFIIFFALWLLIVSSLRVFDVTFDDELSLLSKMPLYYIFALFALAALSLLSFHLKKSAWSVSFAGLFILYFWLTPWVIEPLRVIDTFFHFSRVQVVIGQGYIPTLEKYYFEYPGSTLWGATFLSVTGMESFLFLKYLFPFLSTAILCLGFFCLARRINDSSLPAGPSLLVLSMFGYGGFHFSPFGFAWMIIPILLYLVLQRGKAFSLCFILLSGSLIISHPTTSGFLSVVLLIVIILSTFWKKTSETLRQLLLQRSLIFISLLGIWSLFIASHVFLQNIAAFLQQIFETLFFNTQEVSQKLLQPLFPLFGISIGRRMFVVLSGVFATAILFKGLYMLIKSKGTENLRTQKAWILILISVILVGLLLFPLFLISITVFGLYYFFAFGLFGASLGFGLLKFKSRKRFLFLILLVLLIIIPSFIEAYPVESYSLLRDPIKYGMMFTGQHLIYQKRTIVSPLAQQLYSFMDFNAWQSVENPLPTGSSEFISQVYSADYFIFRIDGAYVASLRDERVRPEETQYWRFSTALMNKSNFAIIYSSGEYLIFAKQKG